MTKIKLCGLSRPCDIEIANELKPEYIGFVFAQGSIRCVSPEQALELKRLLAPEIKAVGVFVNKPPELVAGLMNSGVIDMAQLHGCEDASYISSLRKLTVKPVIQAFSVETAMDAGRANLSAADYVLLDSGAGSGNVFKWSLTENVTRPFFLAGGLDPDNVACAVRSLRPFAVDVSSGIETDGKKDKSKMAAFVAAVRKEKEI